MVKFEKKITQCREAGHKLIENMLRPYERVIIPDWCSLRILELKA